MNPTRVRIGLVPTYRWGMSPWCKKMLKDSLKALKQIKGLELVVAHPSPDDKTIDASKGEVPFGSVVNLDQAEAMAEYFAAQKVDGIIIAALDFGDERSAAKVAEKLQVPVLLYATLEPPALDDAGMSRQSDSYCGNLALAAALLRRKITFHWAGLFMPEDEGLRQEVEKFIGAVSVVKGLKSARGGQVGQRPPSFESVAYDELAMARKFGQNVIATTFSDIDEAARAMADNDPQVKALIRKIRTSYGQVTVGEDFLLKAAKVELALSAFWNKWNLSAMAIQCWPQRSGIALCAVMGRLSERAMFAACETDVLGSLSMLISHRAALGRTVPHLIDWTVQHREDPNKLLAWHCGNAPPCLARDAKETAIRHRNDMKGTEALRPSDGNTGLFQFQLKPGPVTMCRLAEYDGQWKMLITAGEIVPSDEVLCGTWSWVKVRDHAALYRTLVENGFIHHASMIHGDQVETLKLACKFMDVTPVLAL
jgi:L-fucose isomerase-like protein